jgi:bla regulator protein blaR1
MQLIFLIAIPIKAFIEAFVWTLVHSLWQGVLFSVLAACIVYATRKSKASLRYNLLAATLLAFIVCIVVSFCSELTASKKPIENLQQLSIETTSVNAYPLSMINIANGSSAIEEVSLFVTNNASWLFSAWVFIIVFLFIKLSLGLYKVHRIKKQEIFYAPEYWNDKVVELSRLLKISKPFKLLQSGIVKMPVVIGFLKPVILLPASILTSLSANEIEAILLHELAHIRRNDFIVNILQSIAEIIFFFNPSVLWISSLIKIERENCCDDIAIQHTENKHEYIQALVSFQQYSLQTETPFAMGLAGEKEHLLNRVKRMIYDKNKALNAMEKKFLSACLVLLCIGLFAFISNKTLADKKNETPVAEPTLTRSDSQNATQWNTHISKQGESIYTKNQGSYLQIADAASVVVANADSVPVYKVGGGLNLNGETNTSIDGKAYRVVLRNSVVIELYIDGQKIPAEKILDYKSTLDGFYSNMIKNENEYRRNQAQATRDMEQAARRQEEAARVQEEEAKRQEEAAIVQEKAAIARENAARDRELAARDREQAAKDRAQAVSDRAQGVRDAHAANRKMDAVLEDLIRENIIKNKEEVKDLKLNGKVLVVNGVKQPSTIHKKFMDKYLERKSHSIIMTSSFRGTETNDE